jgi:polyisoprenoid-binding protein YceI
MTTTATQTIIPTGTWKSDPIHSQVGFSIRHVVGTFRGSFDDFDVELTVDGGGEPRLSGAVRVASVQVRDENLEGHLLSPEFFDAERFPEITFESSALRADGDGVIVEGELTLKGTRKTVEGRGTITGPLSGPDGSERIGLDLETAVDRTQLGLDWNAELPNGGTLLGDEVTITVHLELVKEE